MTCIFKPDLADPVTAQVSVHAGKIILDIINVVPSRALDAFHHTCAYSELYAEALR